MGTKLEDRTMPIEIESIDENYLQHGQIITKTSLGIQSELVAEGPHVEQVVPLKHAKEMIETARGQLS
jgi:hypothetical protein